MAKIKITEQASRITTKKGLISMLGNVAKELTPKFKGDLTVYDRGFMEGTTSIGAAYSLPGLENPTIPVPAYCIVEERKKDKGDLDEEDIEREHPLTALVASCVGEAIFNYFHQDETSSERKKRLKKEQQLREDANRIKISRRKIFAVRKDFHSYSEACLYDPRAEQVVTKYLKQYAKKFDIPEVNLIKLV